MKRIITTIVMTACAAVLMGSCQKSMPEVKEGVPMTIQASVVTPPETKTIYKYDTSEMALEGFWGFEDDPSKEEAITVVSFGECGITAVDKFFSSGEVGCKKAEFSGTWTGNEGDRIICLYPPVDEYAGISIFDGVREGSPTIYMRNLSTASGALQHDDTGSVSDVDLMLGEVTLSGDVAHVNLRHLLAVFRIEVTLKNFSYDAHAGWPYDMSKINTIRIKCVNPDAGEVDEWGPYGDPVFVRFAGLDVTTYSYTGEPFVIERGPLDYYLLDSGNNSDLWIDDYDIMHGNVVEKTFFVPVRFDGDLKEGYELCFQFGGNYYDDEEERRNSITVFPGCDKRVTMEEERKLENGKVYGFKVTI